MLSGFYSFSFITKKNIFQTIKSISVSRSVHNMLNNDAKNSCLKRF